MKIFDRETIGEGLFAGVILSAFLGLLSITGGYGESIIKYAKFLLLFGVISFALYRLKSELSGESFMLATIGKGFGISAIAGFVVTVVNYLLFLIRPEFSIEMYTLIPATTGQVHLVNLLIMIEFVVLGLLFAFIMFQGLKYRQIEAV